MTSVAATEYEAQRDAITAIIGGIADVGRVHDRPRYGDAADHWITTIGGKPQIRAWEIGLEEPGTEVVRLQQAHRHRYRTWIIRGWVGLEDDAATYHTILTLAGDIADALDATQTLNGACLDHDPVQTGPPIVVTIGGGTLCWGINLTLMAWTVVLP